MKDTMNANNIWNYNFHQCYKASIDGAPSVQSGLSFPGDIIFFEKVINDFKDVSSLCFQC